MNSLCDTETEEDWSWWEDFQSLLDLDEVQELMTELSRLSPQSHNVLATLAHEVKRSRSHQIWTRRRSFRIRIYMMHVKKIHSAIQETAAVSSSRSGVFFSPTSIISVQVAVVMHAKVCAIF